MRASMSEAPQCRQTGFAAGVARAFSWTVASLISEAANEIIDRGAGEAERRAQTPADHERGGQREGHAHATEPPRREPRLHPVKLRLRQPQQWHRADAE